MGTSSSYGGHKDNRSLLPEDYGDGGSGNSNNKDKRWKDVKTQLSKYINGNGGSSPKKTSRNYVKASGGAQKLMQNSSSGINGAINLAKTFNSIKENGIKWTFDRLGIQYKGRSIETIYSTLVNYLAEKSDSKEDGVAREALTDALCKMYEFTEENNLDLSTLDNVPEELMDDIFCTYVESYIWGKVLNDLAICFEKNSYDVERTLAIESEMKTYISNLVSVAFKSKGMKEQIFASGAIEDGVNRLYQMCYEEMEDIE